MKPISREELAAKIRNEARLVLLEALPEQYWREGHLPGARLFPHDRARELAAVAAPRKTDPIVVYCAATACMNSREAADALSELGYEDVRVYVEGKADWQSAGLPLER